MKRIFKNTFIIGTLLATSAILLPAFAQTAPRFTNIAAGPEGSISLTLTGAVLTSYTILATTDLNTSFSPVGVLVTDASGSGTFTDPGTMAVNRQRFYRARQTLPGNTTPAHPANSLPQRRSQSPNQNGVTVAPPSRPAASR